MEKHQIKDFVSYYPFDNDIVSYGYIEDVRESYTGLQYLVKRYKPYYEPNIFWLSDSDIKDNWSYIKRCRQN